jgi:hypothetical protein
MTLYSLDSVVIGYCLNVRGGVVKVRSWARNLSLHNGVKIGSGSYPTSSSLGTRVHFPESKPTEA